MASQLLEFQSGGRIPETDHPGIVCADDSRGVHIDRYPQDWLGMNNTGSRLDRCIANRSGQFPAINQTSTAGNKLFTIGRDGHILDRLCGSRQSCQRCGVGNSCTADDLINSTAEHRGSIDSHHKFLNRALVGGQQTHKCIRSPTKSIVRVDAEVASIQRREFCQQGGGRRYGDTLQ